MNSFADNELRAFMKTQAEEGGYPGMVDRVSFRLEGELKNTLAALSEDPNKSLEERNKEACYFTTLVVLEDAEQVGMLAEAEAEMILFTSIVRSMPENERGLLATFAENQLEGLRLYKEGKRARAEA